MVVVLSGGGERFWVGVDGLVDFGWGEGVLVLAGF